MHALGRKLVCIYYSDSALSLIYLAEANIVKVFST